MNKKPVLIFLHIPKTGGISLIEAINKMLKYKNTLWIENASSFIPPAAAATPPPPLQRMTSSTQKLQREIDSFLKMPQEMRDRLDFIYGHMPYGIHQFLSRPCLYITMLRDPVQRSLSGYYQLMRDVKNNTALNWNIPVQDRNKYTFEEYMIGKHRILKEAFKNQFISYLNNIPHRNTIEADGNIRQQEEHMETVKEYMQKHFMLAGTTQRHSDFLFLLCRMTGHKPPFYLIENKTPAAQRMRSAQLKPDVLAELYRRRAAEYEVYRYVQQLFQEKWDALPAAQRLQAHLYRFILKACHSKMADFASRHIPWRWGRTKEEEGRLAASDSKNSSLKSSP